MKSRGNAFCSSHPPHRDPHSASCRRLRSTKGASKARRDHINHEIRNMRALLPVSRDDQERLSYLHSMAAICTFIRKTVLLRGLPAAERPDRPPPYEAFLPALHGFILVTTAQGRLVYVSENVSEYLGYSMLDVLQGDSVYDMLERSDVDAVKSHLDTEHDSSSERSFICRMQTSKAFRLQHGGGCSMLVRGRYRSFPQPLLPSSSSSSSPLFVALCSPTVDRLQSSDSPSCLSFHSVHGLDMSFTQTSHSVEHAWGYSADELIGRSWYGLIHPEDLSACAAAHTSLLQADEGSRVEMVLRLQCKDLSWTWIYTQANKLCELQGVSCTNFTISETEARFLQTTISGEAFKPSAPCHLHAQQTPPQTQSAKCVKRRRTSDSQSEDQSARRARRESERDLYFMASGCSRGDTSPVPLGDSLALFTPPYSPASSSSSSSSSSPLQHEELSRDLLMDVHRYTMLSSPETCFPEAVLTCHLSPPVPPPAAEQPLEQTAFIRLPARSPLSSSSPAFEFPASDVRLVPGGLSLSDLCESSADCALHQDDLSLLQQPPGGVLLHTHHGPHHVLPLHANLLTPNQSPPSTESDYSEREQEEISILAQQISSLASSFNSYHSLSPHQNVVQPAPSNTSTCDWPPLPLKREQVLEDSVFESLLKDLDMVTSVKSSVSHSGFVSHSYQPGLCSRSRIGSQQLQEEELLGVPSALQEELLPAETFVDPFSVQLGRHGQNSELHQLNQYMQRVLQQDALSEENLY